MHKAYIKIEINISAGVFAFSIVLKIRSRFFFMYLVTDGAGGEICRIRVRVGWPDNIRRLESLLKLPSGEVDLD